MWRIKTVWVNLFVKWLIWWGSETKYLGRGGKHKWNKLKNITKKMKCTRVCRLHSMHFPTSLLALCPQRELPFLFIVPHKSGISSATGVNELTVRVGMGLSERARKSRCGRAHPDQLVGFSMLSSRSLGDVCGCVCEKRWLVCVCLSVFAWHNSWHERKVGERFLLVFH